MAQLQNILRVLSWICLILAGFYMFSMTYAFYFKGVLLDPLDLTITTLIILSCIWEIKR